MQRITRPMGAVAVVCLCILLAAATIAPAAMVPDTGVQPSPVVTGRQLLVEKIAFLTKTLDARVAELPADQRPDLVPGDQFNRASGFDALAEALVDPDHPLYDAVAKAGSLFQRAKVRPALGDDANRFLNLAALDAFDELLGDPSIDEPVRNTLYALIDLLKELELPEAYQVPDTRYTFTGPGRPDDRDRNDRGVTDETDETNDGEPLRRGFRYYGRPYDLETDVSVDSRGFIVFGDGPVDTAGIAYGSLDTADNMPAALSPFVVPSDRSSTTGVSVDGGGVTKTGMRYTYDWTVRSEAGPDLNTSASLYRNDWIVFDYPSVAEGGVAENPQLPSFSIRSASSVDPEVPQHPLLYGLAGLSPGDGNPGSGHPGEGEPRDWHLGDGFVAKTLLSGRSHLDYPGADYTAITSDFVLADTFFIFRPYTWIDGVYTDTPNKYTITAGTRSLLAGGLASLDAALAMVIDDRALLERVDIGTDGRGGEFLPGEMTSATGNQGYASWSGYEYGIQIIGQDAAGNLAVFDNVLIARPDDTVASLDGRDLLNDDGFLAYAVQVEEDVVNRRILQMHQAAYQEGRIASLMDNINTARGYHEIRERDAWLTEKADAQAGRVLKDHNGDWVRVQQYVLRPDDKTVQFLSASLRQVNGEAALSTLDFTVLFRNTGYSGLGNIINLPWNKWLNTMADDSGKFVRTTPLAPLLESMAVTVDNPSRDRFQERRTFTELATDFKQYITNEQLFVNGVDYVNTFDLNNPSNSSVEYSVAGGVGGFQYEIAGRDSINVSLFELSDSGASHSGHEYKDIWDALRVNQGGAYIGDASLEIVIEDTAAAPAFEPFDVVFIPMSRMLWKDDV